MKKINISKDTKNEYDVEWFKKNVKNIDIKDILDYNRNNCWIDTKKEYEVIYEDNEYHFISDGISTFLIKREEFEKGDKVEIVDKDYIYMWYDDWFKEYNIDATYWCYGAELKKDLIYTIVEIRKHTVGNWIVCLIKDCYGRMFLIRDEGIKRV